jgi:hypothetical protein
MRKGQPRGSILGAQTIMIELASGHGQPRHPASAPTRRQFGTSA